ncbi:uncharacterized protein N7446_007927 [Penicillium canescens]|uniref:Uncharacterized protein n=1 Tax=Penicillium canescens TaxID=5083 RepID=A0AAD6NDU9_PENCN|nr:uncharacterized protein N7446_007927 [Penicillium canescens]KAJ6033780.1 hypothetical protein N7444_011551 [Penicillium canescens]KAJ6057027.1 hypothetical protein N7460_000301 [Penicillium canescens]KAJ6058344.1 hypothetical protein N7446_007927 [Penicillium canescens]
MDANAVNVEGYGHNIGWDDCSGDILPEMSRVYRQHFQPSEDMLGFVLQQSQSHLRALAGRESFAGFLNVSLMSDILVKRTEVIFDAPSPCVLQSENSEASTNISWLDVVKAKNYQAEHTGNGVYHFHMRDRGVIVQLSTFQHNMLLSGLPRKLVEPWSYEKDVQMELYTLALAAEMTSHMNQLASEGKPTQAIFILFTGLHYLAVIKVNNTVLEGIRGRDRILRHHPEPSQRSAGSPFPLESAEGPANFTPAVDTGSLDGMAIETEGTDVQSSAPKRGAVTRNFPKNRVWPAEVLKQLPIWFEDQVRKNLSQEEIAQNFHRTFKQKRTFHAIEAKLYSLTGKSPFRKRNKKTSRRRPVSLTPRSSPPLPQPSESVDFTQQLISRSNIEVHALRLAPNLLPYLNSEDCEDGNLYALHGVQPFDPESESSNSYAVPEHDIASQTLWCLHESQGHELQSGTSQNEGPLREGRQAEESPKAHPAFSDLVPESRPTNESSINVLAATSGTVDSYLPRSSPLKFPRISEPIQSPIQHHSEGDTTLEELGRTLIHRTESSAMHVEQNTAHGNQTSERLSPQSSPLGNPLARNLANEGPNNDSHTESGLGASTVPRASTPFQVPEPSSTGNSTYHHSQNCGMDGPTTDTSERVLIDEELIIRCLHEKSQAQAARSHRPWNDKDLNRLPRWLMKRKNLPKERLEVEFLGDFGHYRTSSAIVTACRKKRKADSLNKDVTSAPTAGQLVPVVPTVFDITGVSRSPIAIIGSDTPSLNPSHTIAVPSSNENTTLKHPRLEQFQSPQLNQPQVLDNAERLPRNSPPPVHEDEEAVGQNPPAAVASECASEQMVFSTPENVEDIHTLGSRRHRVEITPEPPARFTTIDGSNVHPTEPNISKMTPLVQMETNEQDALPVGQGIQQTPTGKIVDQSSDDQNVSQKYGPQGNAPNFAEHVAASTTRCQYPTNTHPPAQQHINPELPV